MQSIHVIIRYHCEPAKYTHTHMLLGHCQVAMPYHADFSLAIPPALPDTIFAPEINAVVCLVSGWNTD